jgi:hypothetical protein
LIAVNLAGKVGRKMMKNLAEAAEAPHPIWTQMDVGMNARELMIARPIKPLSTAHGSWVGMKK